MIDEIPCASQQSLDMLQAACGESEQRLLRSGPMPGEVYRTMSRVN